MNQTGRETLLRRACSEQIRLQVDRFGGLDTKAGVLLGFVAAALAGIVGKLTQVASERPDWFASWSKLSWVSFAFAASLVLGVILFLVAACFAVSVLWPRVISMGSDLHEVRQEMEGALQEQRDTDDSIKKFEAPYAEELAMLRSWGANKHSMDAKARWVGWCAVCVGLAVIFLTMSGGLIMVEAVRNLGRQSLAGSAKESSSPPIRPISDSAGKPTPCVGPADHAPLVQSAPGPSKKTPSKTSIATVPQKEK